MRTAIALVDGEHYAPVNQAGLQQLKEEYQVLACVFIGGTEKVEYPESLEETFGVRVFLPEAPLPKKTLPYELVRGAIEELQPDVVYDLSDEPIVTYESRLRMACEVLKAQCEYRGADFHFEPPVFHEVLKKPSLSVYGTAKRVGKTAVAGYIARLLHDSEFDPLIITMGRGGPVAPEVIHGKELSFSPEFLVSQSEQGKHACSDHWEDAYTSRVTTVGCRRCAGGMAGKVFMSNVLEGARIANDQPESFVVVEGSGATMPPLATQGKIVVVGAHQPLDYLKGYFGGYRLGLADLVIITGCDEGVVSSRRREELMQAVQSVAPQVDVAMAVLRPKPLEDITNAKVFIVTTAPEEVICSQLIPYLEVEYKCKVTGFSSSLSHRKKLREDMKHMNGAQVVMSEIKAAGVDVVAAQALKNHQRMVFMDNVPQLVSGGNIESLDRSVLNVAERSVQQRKIIDNR